jgi:hypothetical protein
MARNMSEANMKYAKPATRKKYEEQRTKFYEAQFAAKDKNNPNGAAMLKRATAKLAALGEIVYNESASRKVGRNTTLGTTISMNAARGGSNAAKFRPKSPSASSLPRSAAKKTTKTFRTKSK